MIKDNMSAEEAIAVSDIMELGYMLDTDGTIYADKYCLDKHIEYVMENGMQNKMTIE
jgi:hypothetical protein